MTTIKLSLMCKSHDYRLIDQSSNTFRTSSWQMSQKKASSLIGESVTLTESKNKPAYMGGEIIDVIPVKDSNRFDIVFNAKKSFTGNTEAINHPGWGNGRAVCYV
mgnify:CR=1 FL=1|jgi:hypothetical protein